MKLRKYLEKCLLIVCPNNKEKLYIYMYIYTVLRASVVISLNMNWLLVE